MAIFLINQGATISHQNQVTMIDLADPEHLFEEGNTPLSLACRYGYGNLATMLLSRGADIEAMNNVSDSSPFPLTSFRMVTPL
jgi:ankyrin repeat protein